MFAVGIYGGLASQMNQYAFMRVLKRKFPDVEVKMAVAGDWRRYMEHNGYELDRVFGIERDSIDWKTLRHLANFYPWHGWFAKAMNGLYQLRDRLVGPKPTHITFPILKHADWTVFDRLDPAKDYLLWSNYAMDYFDEDELRSIFVFRPPLEERNAELMDEIRGCESVSIHVRRGDYLKYGFPLMPASYYRQAVELIRKSVVAPRFFVFSNDPDWVDANFDFLPEKTVVRGNLGIRSYVDLQLMSACQHNILANSGYSLFAAWLNANPSKKIISPEDISCCQ